MSLAAIEKELQHIPLSIWSEPSIQPAASCNQPLSLYNGTGKLSQGSIHYNFANSEITLDWLPRARLRLTIPDMEGWSFPFKLAPATLKLPASGSHKVGITDYQIPAGTLRATIYRPAIFGPSNVSNAAYFHLTNFHDLVGAPIRSDSHLWRGRLTLHSSRWIVEIDQRPDLTEAEKDLRATGGYLVTHAGRIRSASGKAFGRRDAQSALSNLFFFISFCRGLWSGPVLIRGRTSRGIGWESWYLPKVKPWKAISSWFPILEPKSLQMLSLSFAQFERCLSSRPWQETLSRVIHWYVEANCDAGGLGGGIILSQSALELLAWTCLTEDPALRSFSKTRFSKLSAADKIDALLRRLGIPAGLPKGFAAAQRAAKNLGVSGSPGCIVQVRNALVHGEQARRRRIEDLSFKAQFQVRETALRLVELCLLRLLDYNGLYYDRSLNGAPEQVSRRVPWAS